MIYTIILCLSVGVIWTLRGWSLHRNSIPYKRPSDWYAYAPFKATDSLALTILKGMQLSLQVAPIAAACWFMGWLVGRDGWLLAEWILGLFNIIVLLFEGRSICFTLKWWFWYLTPAARDRFRSSWQRDGYSAF